VWPGQRLRLSEDGERWISSRPDFLIHVKVLSRLFRGRLLAMLAEVHAQDSLRFFGDHAALADKRAFKRFLARLRRTDWVVYSKRPFAGPKQVLAYLSRYTHRVAISNRRLVSADDNAVAFRWKDYRVDGPGRWKTMTLSPHEFIRRFLLHVLPKGFHRIRHYGLFANGDRATNIARARDVLGVAPRMAESEDAAAAPDEPRALPCPCPRCGGRMIVIEVFARGWEPKYQRTHAPTPIGIDTS
jgi:putative transposase